MTPLTELLQPAFAARQAFLDREYFSAFRLFNGFLEGCPAISIDIYARTALLHNYADDPDQEQVSAAQAWIQEQLPWVQCILSKKRNGNNDERRGSLLYGAAPDRKVRENGVWYAIDLCMNRDASFYLDTRNLRSWAKEALGGKSVLNTFAYTGSLGVAALAGGANRVVQLDRNRNFLNLAKNSYTLNGFPVAQKDFFSEDFFPCISHFKRSGQEFDCVFLDPPFFATTAKGKVDLETGSTKLINKVRPLIKHNGWLVTINNALFVSGQEYLASLEALCASGYLSLEQLIPVSQDFTGFPGTRSGNSPVDPAPFNHSTKIAILRVKRKSEMDE
jgi:23S rRNA (cytosine1962-C5)-methyltransferase